MIKFSQTLPQFVEAMFSEQMGSSLGLQFSIDARYWRPGYPDCDIVVMRHIIIHRPNNYTKVLVSPKKGFTDLNLSPFLNGGKEEYFEKHSDHDSCWKTDGFQFLSQDYFNASSILRTAPKDMESYIGFGYFGYPKYVHIKKLNPIYDVEKHSSYIKGYNIKLNGVVELSAVHQYIGKELVQ